MATLTIERADGSKAQATYVRHLRTLTSSNSLGGRNRDLELFRLDDGSEIICESPADDARGTPTEREGLTPEAAMFIE